MTEFWRYNDGKPEVSYLLSFGEALWHVCAVCMQGAKKYARDNWKNGGDMASKDKLIDSLGRHLIAIGMGEDRDEDTGCLHIAAVVWNALAYIWHHHRGEPLVVRPNRLDDPEEYK